ncbi:MAG: hypothetical protein ACHQUC_06710 [Chlamydiales bacterium]
MAIKQIFVLKETRTDESRVALTPTEVTLLAAKKFQLFVESNAGSQAGFKDLDYANAGAEIFSITPRGFLPDSLILRVKRAHQAQEHFESTLFGKNTTVIGFLDPLDPSIKNGYDHIAPWQKAGVTALALELMKFPPNDPRDAQAAMSRIAGRLALKSAIKHYLGPHPIRVTVMGTGPAGLSAALEAKKQGASVQLFGRKEHLRKFLEEAGITYHILPEGIHPAKLIQSYLSQETIVITAARTVGSKSPLLIDEAGLEVLPEKAVVVDLAAGEGGNVAGSKSDHIVTTKKGVMIINVSGYPKEEPHEASQAYAKCMFNLLSDLLTENGEIVVEHPLFSQGWVTHQGKRNPLY